MPVAANGCRLRKARFSESGRIYLLTAVAHQREPVFADWRLGRLLVDQLRCADEASLVTSMAWVVMPDHLHWLMELKHGTLAELMCRIKSRSSRSINVVRQGQGRLWQRGYYDRALRRDEDIKDAARYIVACGTGQADWRLPTVGCHLALKGKVKRSQPSAAPTWHRVHLELAKVAIF